MKNKLRKGIFLRIAVLKIFLLENQPVTQFLRDELFNDTLVACTIFGLL